MAREVEPVDRVAARLIIAAHIIALRGFAHIVLSGDRAIFAGHSLAVLAGLLAAAQLLDFRLRRSKIAARALELEAQHDHRDQEHQRKRQQSHKKHIKRIAPRFAAADPTSFHNDSPLSVCSPLLYIIFTSYVKCLSSLDAQIHKKFPPGAKKGDDQGHLLSADLLFVCALLAAL